jgi:hypothetical protein
MFVTRRYKGIMLVGLAIRVIGVGIMIRSRGADGRQAYLNYLAFYLSLTLVIVMLS